MAIVTFCDSVDYDAYDKSANPVAFSQGPRSSAYHSKGYSIGTDLDE